jgi:hypothetical protein
MLEAANALKEASHNSPSRSKSRLSADSFLPSRFEFKVSLFRNLDAVGNKESRCPSGGRIIILCGRRRSASR